MDTKFMYEKIGSDLKFRRQAIDSLRMSTNINIHSLL